MATRIERHHASAFVIKEDQQSRSSRTLASGQWLQAGTVLEEADGKVTAFVSGTIAGVLLNETNALSGDVLSPVLARVATVALDELTFPAESRDAVIAGLLAKGIVSMFSPQLADTGGGGGGYVAKAVRLGLNSAMMVWSTLPDASQLTISQWTRADAAAISQFPVIVGQDFISEAEIGFVNNTDIGGIFYPKGQPANQYIRYDTADGLFTSDVYHHFFLTVDTGFDTPNKKIACWFDGVPVIEPSNITDLGSAFNIPTNGLGFGFPDAVSIGSNTQAMDYCDPQVWIGQYIDPALHIDKFRDPATGKPVDPAIPAATFGQQSILYSGDHTAFQINQGNAGSAFLVTGAGATGSNGAGSVTCTNATVGAPIVKVQTIDFTTGDVSFITEQFEATISVDGQIQQTSSNDNSALQLFVYLANATIADTDAP